MPSLSSMQASVSDPWSGLNPDDLRDVFRRPGVSWWISGGWAIELFVPGYSREHGDIDVGRLRADPSDLRSWLRDWEVYAAADGGLSPIGQEEPVPTEVATVWCKSRDARAWGFQVMIEEADEHEWAFRRDPAIRRPLDRVHWTCDEGVPVLRPEIQLLYKAKTVSGRDQADFDAVLPHLAQRDRTWLAHAIGFVHPGHPWLEPLEKPRAPRHRFSDPALFRAPDTADAWSVPFRRTARALRGDQPRTRRPRRTVPPRGSPQRTRARLHQTVVS